MTSLMSLLMLLYSRNGCNLIWLKLSVFLDKGNDAENKKPSSDVLFIHTRQTLSNSKLVLNIKNVSFQNIGNSSFIIFIRLHLNIVSV